jgi:nucleoside-diphosphate-sugar epimerase
VRTLILGGTGVLSHAVATATIQAGHQVTIVTDGNGILPAPEGLHQHLLLNRNNAQALQAALTRDDYPNWDLVVDAICYSESQAADLLPALQNRSKHTIVISTNVIYDWKNSLPLRPNDSLLLPEQLKNLKYEAGKVAMEAFWLRAWKETGHPVTILRLPHILGTGCNLGIIPLHNRDPWLLTRLLSYQPLLLADGGHQIMQVVFNQDVAQVILAASGKTETFGKVYNCANPEVITGQEYFAEIANHLNVPLRIKTLSSQVIQDSDWGWATTMVSRVMDMTSLQEDIQTCPNTPLKAAISHCVNYLRKQAISVSFDQLDYLAPVENLLNQEDTILREALSKSAKLRPRTLVDLRMNRHTTELRLEKVINHLV